MLVRRSVLQCVAACRSVLQRGKIPIVSHPYEICMCTFVYMYTYSYLPVCVYLCVCSCPYDDVIYG